MLVHCGTLEVADLLKSTFCALKDDGRHPNFHSLNRYNSAADCLISLIFGTEFDHITADTFQMFKIKGSKVKVTAYR